MITSPSRPRIFWELSHLLLLSVAIYEEEKTENAAKAADGGHWIEGRAVLKYVKLNNIIEIWTLMILLGRIQIFFPES